VQKDALAMSKLGGDGLVEDLFGLLDDDQHPTSVQGVRNVISSWLKQTVIFNPSAWIDLCQRIMARTTASQQVADAAANQQQQHNQRDDEGESLNVRGEDSTRDPSREAQVGSGRKSRKLTSWLHSICSIVASSGRKEHLNAIVARISEHEWVVILESGRSHQDGIYCFDGVCDGD
jgi:HEAT repeat-containing protein 5